MHEEESLLQITELLLQLISLALNPRSTLMWRRNFRGKTSYRYLYTLLDLASLAPLYLSECSHWLQAIVVALLWITLRQSSSSKWLPQKTTQPVLLLLHLLLVGLKRRSSSRGHQEQSARCCLFRSSFSYGNSKHIQVPPTKNEFHFTWFWFHWSSDHVPPSAAQSEQHVHTIRWGHVRRRQFSGLAKATSRDMGLGIHLWDAITGDSRPCDCIIICRDKAKEMRGKNLWPD